MTKIAYHVDRSRRLHEGQTLELDRLKFSDAYSVSELFNAEWPDGLSSHGIHYLSDSGIYVDLHNGAINFDDINSHIIELAAEYVRLALHHEYPSRFQCLFAVNEISDLEGWRQYFLDDPPVYEVLYEESTPAFDASFLKGGINSQGKFFSSAILYCAERYWNQEISDSPMKEILIQLPVSIGKCIGSFNSFIK